MEYITQNAEETKEIGRKLSANLKGGDVFALCGDLGSGKTTFVQGFAEGLGISARVNSPTFIIVRTYSIPTSKNNFPLLATLYHVDLYRLEKNVNDELAQLGLIEAVDDKKSIVVIEWAERARDMLPKHTRWIQFKNVDENKRKITINEDIY